MLLTSTDIANYLNLTLTDSLTTQIELLIPAAIKTGISKTLNEFKCSGYVIENDNFSFSSQDKSITDSAGDFIDYYWRRTDASDLVFSAGDVILVENSLRNDGYYTLSKVDNNVVTTEESLNNEDEEAIIKIWKIDFPEDFKLQVAQYVGALLNIEYGLKNESMGKWSGSYMTPDEIATKIFCTRKHFTFK